MNVTDVFWGLNQWLKHDTVDQLELMKDPMFPASPLHSDASIFARSLISTGQLFLTGSELSEEAAQPAVAYNECLQQRSMWVCVSASSTLSPASSPLPLPLGLPQHNRVPSALTIPPSLPFVYRPLPKSCLSLLCASLFFALYLALAPLLLSVSPYLYPIVPSFLWLTVL